LGHKFAFTKKKKKTTRKTELEQGRKEIRNEVGEKNSTKKRGGDFPTLNTLNSHR